MSPEALDATVEVLENQIRTYEASVRSLNESIRDLQVQIDQARLENRPSWPTDAHREGIANACRILAARTQNADHLGDPCGPDDDPYCVSYSLGRGVQANVPSDGGVIYVRMQAPFSKRGRGRLWHVSESELDAVFAHVDACGFTVTDHWEHDQGTSLIVAPHN